jgi:hypothetical protein
LSPRSSRDENFGVSEFEQPLSANEIRGVIREEVINILDNSFTRELILHPKKLNNLQENDWENYFTLLFDEK